MAAVLFCLIEVKFLAVALNLKFPRDCLLASFGSNKPDCFEHFWIGVRQFAAGYLELVIFAHIACAQIAERRRTQIS